MERLLLLERAVTVRKTPSDRLVGVNVPVAEVAVHAENLRLSPAVMLQRSKSWKYENSLLEIEKIIHSKCVSSCKKATSCLCCKKPRDACVHCSAASGPLAVSGNSV